VVLVETSHPGNVGSAARAMKTMGLSDLVLVAPRRETLAAEPEAIALASNATDVLAGARVVASLGDALCDATLAIAFTARKRELSHPHLSLRDAAQVALDRLAEPQVRVALVFGNEAMCLSNEDVDRCQVLASIPANPEYPSLNLAQSVQVAAYEMMMAAAGYKVEAGNVRPRATVGDVEKLLAHLERAAIDSGFLDPNSPKRFMTRMRRLATRAALEREEVNILRGLLASFEAALESSRQHKPPC
jgi:tRNA/rRNA methyltransferase